KVDFSFVREEVKGKYGRNGNVGLDDEIPNHSVLSKARTRWGGEVFESLFVRSVSQCVEAGLVGGGLLHINGSLIDANASRDTVLKSDPEMIRHLRQAYGVQEAKLEKPAPKRLRKRAPEAPGEDGAAGEGKKSKKARNLPPVNRELLSHSDP